MAREPVTPQWRQHVIFAGRWRATPRWLFWKPRWRRRVLQYERDAHADADYIWQYATDITGIVDVTVVNSGQEPEVPPPQPEADEAASPAVAQPHQEANEAESGPESSEAAVPVPLLPPELPEAVTPEAPDGAPAPPPPEPPHAIAPLSQPPDPETVEAATPAPPLPLEQPEAAAPPPLPPGPEPIEIAASAPPPSPEPLEAPAPPPPPGPEPTETAAPTPPLPLGQPEIAAPLPPPGAPQPIETAVSAPLPPPELPEAATSPPLEPGPEPIVSLAPAPPPPPEPPEAAAPSPLPGPEPIETAAPAPPSLPEAAAPAPPPDLELIETAAPAPPSPPEPPEAGAPPPQSGPEPIETAASALPWSPEAASAQAPPPGLEPIDNAPPAPPSFLEPPEAAAPPPPQHGPEPIETAALSPEPPEFVAPPPAPAPLPPPEPVEAAPPLPPISLMAPSAGKGYEEARRPGHEVPLPPQKGAAEAQTEAETLPEADEGDEPFARSPDPLTRTPPRRHRPVLGILLTCAAAALAVGLGWAAWDAYMGAAWTRDGTVRVHVVTLAPEVAGRIVELPVADNQFVHKGDLLMRIDPTDYKIAVSLAEAALQQSQANVQNSMAQAARRRRLSPMAATLEEKQNFATSADIAEAQYRQAVANLDQARVNLKRTEIRSPVNGWITNLLTRRGDYATVGVTKVSVVDADSFWVDAYFEETNLSSIREGDQASVRLMGYTAIVRGHVDSISRGINVANAQPDVQGIATVNPIFTWVRLAQRVPVRIHIDNVPQGVRLVAGLTATVQIDSPQRSDRFGGWLQMLRLEAAKRLRL